MGHYDGHYGHYGVCTHTRTHTHTILALCHGTYLLVPLVPWYQCCGGGRGGSDEQTPWRQAVSFIPQSLPPRLHNAKGVHVRGSLGGGGEGGGSGAANGRTRKAADRVRASIALRPPSTMCSCRSSESAPMRRSLTTCSTSRERTASPFLLLGGLLWSSTLTRATTA